MLINPHLSWHHFSVVTRNVDAGIEAAPVVALHDVATVDPVGPDAAVVRTLRSGEPVLGPAERVVVLVQQGVLLFNPKPGLVLLGPV